MSRNPPQRIRDFPTYYIKFWYVPLQTESQSPVED